MAQHIVNIAFDFDDEKAREAAEKAVDNEMYNIVKNIILDKLAPEKSGWYSSSSRKERDWSRFNAKVDDQIRDFIEENKEAIIEHAASKVADSIKRTKAWKEKTDEILLRKENKDV